MLATLRANNNLNFVQRVPNRAMAGCAEPMRSYSNHLIGFAKIETKLIAFPTLLLRQPNPLGRHQSWRGCEERPVHRLPQPDAAERFADNGYKVGLNTGLMHRCVTTGFTARCGSAAVIGVKEKGRPLPGRPFLFVCDYKFTCASAAADIQAYPRWLPVVVYRASTMARSCPAGCCQSPADLPAGCCPERPGCRWDGWHSRHSRRRFNGDEDRQRRARIIRSPDHQRRLLAFRRLRQPLIWLSRLGFCGSP